MLTTWQVDRDPGEHVADGMGGYLAWDETDASERIYRVRVERVLCSDSCERGEFAWLEAGDVEWLDAPSSEVDRAAIVAAVVRSWRQRDAQHDLACERDEARYHRAA